MSSRSQLWLPMDALHHLKALSTHIHADAVHETQKHKFNPPPLLQHTTLPPHLPRLLPLFLNTHYPYRTHTKPKYSDIPFPRTHSQSTDCLSDAPTLPLTIVSVCCSLYLMHAGPPLSQVMVVQNARYVTCPLWYFVLVEVWLSVWWR